MRGRIGIRPEKERASWYLAREGKGELALGQRRKGRVGIRPEKQRAISY